LGIFQWLKAFVGICETYVVLVRGPFDFVAGSYADTGGEGFEFDGESGERGGGEEGG
jgi:hypothetical protein